MSIYLTPAPGLRQSGITHYSLYTRYTPYTDALELSRTRTGSDLKSDKTIIWIPSLSRAMYAMVFRYIISTIRKLLVIKHIMADLCSKFVSKYTKQIIRLIKSKH